MVGYEPLGDLWHDHLTFVLGTIGDIRVDMSMRMAIFAAR
jgi:hypothetical protein